MNLELTRSTLNDIGNCSSTDAYIWLAIHKNRCNLSINIRSFLWKLIHNGHKVSHYWLKMENFNKRGICSKCDTPETMQHILFNCNTNQSKTIWNAAKKICEHKNIQWPINFDITTIMALPFLKVQAPDG